MPIVVRIVAAITPLLLTLLFAYATMEGYFNFGSGEKDVLIAVPLLLWSLVFLISFLVAWWRGLALGRAIVISAVIAMAFVAVAWIALFAASLVFA
jgi:hypothetical protein